MHKLLYPRAVENGSAKSTVQIHNYRSRAAINTSVFGMAITAGIGYVFVDGVRGSTWSDGSRLSHPVSPWAVAITAAVFVALLIWAGFGLLGLLNTRIVIDDDGFIFRSRFKRETRVRKDQVLHWEPKFLGPRTYTVATTVGRFKYTPEISRRAELDRYFRAAIGFRDPEPEPAPRHWSGRTTFRLWSSAAISRSALWLLYVGAMEWISWDKERKLILWHEDRLLAASLLCVLLFSAYDIVKMFRESVTVEGGEMVFKDVWGRKKIVRLDDITSIDYQPFNIAAPRIYTRSESVNINTMLKDYKELVWRIQRMTASPHP